MECDEEEALFRYLFEHCPQFMTALERKAARAALGRTKAMAAAGGDAEKARPLLLRWGRIDESDVNAVLADGTEAFQRRVARRSGRAGCRGADQSLSALPPRGADVGRAPVFLVRPRLA